MGSRQPGRRTHGDAAYYMRAHAELPAIYLAYTQSGAWFRLEALIPGRDETRLTAQKVYGELRRRGLDVMPPVVHDERVAWSVRIIVDKRDRLHVVEEAQIAIDRAARGPDGVPTHRAETMWIMERP